MTNDNKVGTNGDAGKGVTLSHWQRVGRQVWIMPFLLYLVKCLLGTVICYGFYVLVPQYHLYWSLVSVLMVLAPDHLDSIKAALCIGVPVTILVCYLLGFGNAARSALAAIIIVFIQENESGNWQIAMERMGAVVLGCLVALALTLLFHWGDLLAARRRSALCSEMDGE